MYITREKYDLNPLLIKQGALLLWGISLAKREDSRRVRHLYQLNDFFAEMCYETNTGRLTCICTFTNAHQLAPYRDQLDSQPV